MKRTPKVIVRQSSIENIGNGLFATEAISKGSIISEFRGKLLKPTDNVDNLKSLIRFGNGYYLECYADNVASSANDPIQFPSTRRKLYETLNKTEPFYHLNPKAKLNSYIKLNENKYRAFLVATTDIKKDEEVFCHYGFSCWFMLEFTNGFIFEDQMDKEGFPSDLYTYPAFKLYINEFYPTFSKYKVESDTATGETTIIISYPNSAQTTVIVLANYAKLLRKTDLSKISIRSDFTSLND